MGDRLQVKACGPRSRGLGAPLRCRRTGRVCKAYADLHRRFRRAGQVRSEEPCTILLGARACSPKGPGTRGLQGWIQDNVVPLVLLGIAIILLWIGGRGDNAGVARRSVGSDRRAHRAGHRGLRADGPAVGAFLARLITG